jgi:tetratricopeptide (TPR) repeat protein
MPEKAIESWQKALAMDESCADAYWRIARAHYWLGSQAKDDAKKRQFFKDGIEYAKLGVSADPESTACRFWLGVMYGSYGQAVGASQSLHMVDPIKQEMQWILANDEGFDEGGAHRVLGRLFYKLPGIMGGDNQKAKDHLRRALELGNKNTLNFLYLAEVHIDEGEKDQARALLTKLLSLPDDPDYLPESRQNKARAQELLRELGNE